MTAWEPSAVRPPGRVDLYIALALFVVSWATAAFYLPAFRASGGHGEFYQEEFAPAVLSACGRGYVSITGDSAPRSLGDFLQRRVDTFDCRDLPAHVETAQLSIMQAAFKYLMMSAALVWRVTGVSWKSVDIVLSLMFAVSITAGYAALRSAAGPVLSAVGSLFWLISPMHLGNLPHLRDYSKTPYFLLTLVAMGVVVRERRLARLVLAGALFGLVQGIGFGMRTDVILNFAPFLLVLFVAGARRMVEDLPAKIACAVAAVLMFAVVGWPILRAYGGESEGLSHVALLGLMTPFDEPLGIRRAAYDVGYLYNDSFAAAEVDGYWARTRRGATSTSPAAVPYATASRTYYRTLATTFPGDFLTRMAGSIIQTLNLPFGITYGRAPAGAGGVLAALGEWRTRLMLSLIGTGPLVALALLFIVGVANLRDGIVGLGLFVFWTAYPFIQFHGRHTFHLEFLVIAGFMALFSLAARSAISFWRGARPAPLAVARAAGLLAAAVLMSVIAIAVGRAVQEPQVRALLERYEDAPIQPLRVDALFDPPAGQARMQQAMIAVEASCPAPVSVTVRYDAPADRDFTRTMQVPASARVFMPVYANEVATGGSARFTGIDGPACVRASRIRGIDQVLWIDAVLTPGWRQQPLHQRVYLGTAFPERIWLKLAQWWPSLATLG